MRAGCGCAQSTVCSHVNAGFLGVELARLQWHAGIPFLWVTFDLCPAPPTLTLAHPNPSTSVNEFEDPHAIVWPECLLVKGW